MLSPRDRTGAMVRWDICISRGWSQVGHLRFEDLLTAGLRMTIAEKSYHMVLVS